MNEPYDHLPQQGHEDLQRVAERIHRQSEKFEMIKLSDSRTLGDLRG